MQGVYFIHFSTFATLKNLELTQTQLWNYF